MILFLTSGQDGYICLFICWLFGLISTKTWMNDPQPRIDSVKCWYRSGARDMSRISLLTFFNIINLGVVVFLVCGSGGDTGLFGPGGGVCSTECHSLYLYFLFVTSLRIRWTFKYVNVVFPSRVCHLQTP